MKIMHRLVCFLSLLFCSFVAFAQSAPSGLNGVVSLAHNKNAAGIFLKIGFREPLTAPPSSFGIANPARLVFDLPATENALNYSSKTIDEGAVRSLNVVQAGDRTRLVLNLDKPMKYETQLDGKSLLISLMDTGTPSAESASAPKQHFGSADKSGQAIRDIQFRRGKDGSGVVNIDLSSSDGGVDIYQRGGNLQVSFKQASLPDNLLRQLDVGDFATPIKSVKTRRAGEDVLIDITPSGLWEHSAFQSDNQFVVEIKVLKEDPNKLVQGSKTGYQGEPIDLDFQSVPVLELLRVFADISKFNIVTSDAIASAGNVTLRMRDVPWDQAFDIVLEMKNLAKRKNGNVIWVGTSREMLDMEKRDLEARQAIGQLEPVVTESFQINYQKAEDVQKMLSNKDQPILSKAGSVVIDAYSNRVFVTDVPSRLNKVKELIALIDKATEQVMLEARIVEARDNYGRDLGVRMQFLNTATADSSGAVRAGDIFLRGGATSGTGQTSAFTGQTAFTVPGAMGQLNFSLFNASLTRILNLELQAMETDGKGKTMSNPRVVTRNNVKALIEQGDEIPVVTPGAANAPPTVTYRKAKLSFEVTPQITPDRRVKMKMIISRDRPDWGNTVQGNPTIVTAKVETEVLVDNGGTLVIGGVTIDNETTSTDRIPFLGDLPYVGFLFKMKAVARERNELLVFITPRIVDENLNLR
jgi:type IV pilus assembly protein PilQ